MQTEDRRYGKVRVNSLSLMIGYEKFAQIFHHTVTLNVEHNLAEDYVTYTLWNPDFRQLSVGEKIPQYTVIITHNDVGNPLISFHEVKLGEDYVPEQKL